MSDTSEYLIIVLAGFILIYGLLYAIHSTIVSENRQIQQDRDLTSKVQKEWCKTHKSECVPTTVDGTIIYIPKGDTI